MGVNKVNFGNNTLIDLTGDTITASTLAMGVTAHSADGEAIVGSMIPGGGGHTILDGNGNALTQRDNLQFSGGLWARDVSILNGLITKSMVIDGMWTDPVTALTGDTSVTIINAALHTSSKIDIYCQTSNGSVPGYNSVVVTEGQAIISFDALQQNTDWVLCIKNVTPTIDTVTSWSDASYDVLAFMLNAHYNGDIDISDYWSVGDERIVSLSAMNAETVDESHSAQNVTIVLTNVGGKTLADGVTECAFQWDLKDGLSEFGSMVNTYETGNWNKCRRRTWCNDTFYNSIDPNFKALLKQFINKTKNYDGNVFETTDWTALRSITELYGPTDDDGYQIEYYTTAANLTKSNQGSQGFWTRSNKENSYYDFYFIYNGSKYTIEGRQSKCIAPFGVI